jgi:hypothetical protein
MKLGCMRMRKKSKVERAALYTTLKSMDQGHYSTLTRRNFGLIVLG